MEAMNLMLMHNLAVIICIMAILLIVLLVIVVVLHKKLSIMKQKYDFFTQGEAVNIDTVLTDTLQELRTTKADLEVLEQKHAALRQRVRGCLQTVKLERYDAFEAMGGEMSYSMLLADENNDGIILTSIYGREESRSFAKDVKAGKSSYALADEEKKLLS